MDNNESILQDWWKSDGGNSKIYESKKGNKPKPDNSIKVQRDAELLDLIDGINIIFGGEA